MDTKEALVEYVRASMEFLDFVAGEKKGELLKEAVTHEQYGEWVSEKRKEEFPKELARLWEIHVSPRDDEE
jgi:platelet-activating factor acetylhydrolase